MAQGYLHPEKSILVVVGDVDDIRDLELTITVCAYKPLKRGLELVRKRQLRKGDGEGTSLTRLTFSIDITTVGTGNCLNEAKAKTGTSLCPTSITPVEPFKYMRKIILRDSDPRITDGERNLPIFCTDRNRNIPCSWSVLQGIIEEIGNHSLELSWLSIDDTSVRQISNDLHVIILSYGLK